MKAKLTIVVLTKNEEDKIARCLESVKWADEIVIVDGYSTDKTLYIAKSYIINILKNKFFLYFFKSTMIVSFVLILQHYFFLALCTLYNLISDTAPQNMPPQTQESRL